MRKFACAIIVMSAIGVSACGSTSHPKVATKSAVTTSGYFNMTTLGTAIQQEADQRADSSDEPGPTSVVCISTGHNSATCNGQWPDGTGETVNATINSGGTEYITSDGS
jgi:hypothetical protein